MAWENIQEKYTPRDNNVYRHRYHQIIIGVISILGLMLILVGIVLFQLFNRPEPIFKAMQPDGDTMQLRPYMEPNLLPDTILRWASKAATVAYTYNYVSYRKQIDVARTFFTDAGWEDFGNTLGPFLDRIIANQLFVYSVVYDTPVISNQGPLPGKGNVWRVQIPFLVTYQSANTQVTQKYYVVLTIVQVPTYVNPQGIGIDRFVMV